MPPEYDDSIDVNSLVPIDEYKNQNSLPDNDIDINSLVPIESYKSSALTPPDTNTDDTNTDDIDINSLVPINEYPVPAPIKKPEKRGLLEDIGKSVAANALGQLPETYGRALQVLDPDGGIEVADWTGKKLQQFGEYVKAQDFAQPSKESQESYLRRSITGGIGNLPTSIGIGLPGAIAGFAGGPVGAIGGFAASGGTIAGLAQYHQFMEDAVKKGIDPETVKSEAVMSAFLEGGSEAASDALMLLLGGAAKPFVSAATGTLRGVLTQPLKDIALELGKTAIAEVSTEVLNAAGQAYIAKKAGLSDASSWDAAKEAFGPALVMSMFFGLGVQGMNTRKRKHVREALTNANTNQQARTDAVNEIADSIAEKDESIAEQWKEEALRKIENNEAIDLDTQLGGTEELSVELANNIIEDVSEVATGSGEEYKKYLDEGSVPGEIEKARELFAKETYDLLGGKPLTGEKTMPSTVGKHSPYVPLWERSKSDYLIGNDPTVINLPYEPTEKPSLIPGMSEKEIEEAQKKSDINFENTRKQRKDGVELIEGEYPEKIEDSLDSGLLDFMKSRIQSGQAGKRMQNESGEWFSTGSGYPQWFRDKGYTAKEITGLIDKLEKGEKLTDIQRAKLDDLAEGAHKEYRQYGGVDEVDPQSLNIGDTYESEGRTYKVVGTNEDGIVIEDQEYGEQTTIDPFDTFEIDRFTRRGKESVAPAFDDRTSFDFVDDLQNEEESFELQPNDEELIELQPQKEGEASQNTIRLRKTENGKWTHTVNAEVSGGGTSFKESPEFNTREEALNNATFQMKDWLNENTFIGGSVKEYVDRLNAELDSLQENNKPTDITKELNPSLFHKEREGLIKPRGPKENQIEKVNTVKDMFPYGEKSEGLITKRGPAERGIQKKNTVKDITSPFESKEREGLLSSRTKPAERGIEQKNTVKDIDNPFEGNRREGLIKPRTNPAERGIQTEDTIKDIFPFDEKKREPLTEPRTKPAEKKVKPYLIKGSELLHDIDLPSDMVEREKGFNSKDLLKSLPKPEKKASVKAFLTNKDKQALVDLGYNAKDVERLSKNPQEAERIISKGEKKPSPQTAKEQKTPKHAQELRDLGYSLEEIKGISLQEAEEIISKGTRKAESTTEQINQAANEAATSPQNDLPKPTPKQIEAGTYKKGHVNFQGLDISIENPRGSTRSGMDKNGKKWSIELKDHYGYIKRTKGKDKDHIDVFIGDNTDSKSVTVINQVDPVTGKFDEHKVMLGYNSLYDARLGYKRNYEQGWEGIGSLHELNMEEFKTWLKEGDTTKPYGEKQKKNVAFQPGDIITPTVDSGLLHITRVHPKIKVTWANERDGITYIKTDATGNNIYKSKDFDLVKKAEEKTPETVTPEKTKVIDGFTYNEIDYTPPKGIKKVVIPLENRSVYYFYDTENNSFLSRKTQFLSTAKAIADRENIDRASNQQSNTTQKELPKKPSVPKSVRLFNLEQAAIEANKNDVSLNDFAENVITKLSDWGYPPPNESKHYDDNLLREDLNSLGYDSIKQYYKKGFIEKSKNTKSELYIEDYDDDYVIVKGDTYKHKNQIKSAYKKGQRYNRKWNPSEKGWMFPKSELENLREHLGDLVEQPELDNQTSPITQNEKNLKSTPKNNTEILGVDDKEAIQTDKNAVESESIKEKESDNGRVDSGKSDGQQVLGNEANLDDGQRASDNVENVSGKQAEESHRPSGKSGNDNRISSGTRQESGERPGRGSSNRDNLSDRSVDGGRKTSGSDSEKSSENLANEPLKEPAKKAPKTEADRNHVIKDEDTLIAGGKVSRLRANVSAIKLLRQLEKENRNPTPEEKNVLAQFTGWGSLSQEVFAFDEYIKRAKNYAESSLRNKDSFKNDPVKETKSFIYGPVEREKFDKWVKDVSDLHPYFGGLLSREEWDAARASTMNAHYTSREIIKHTWKIIEKLGFKGGKVLEPSAGVGHFFGLMPEGLQKNSSLSGVELDSVTGGILKKLYPEASIQVTGFEKAKGMKNNRFDVVVSNFPFGSYKITDTKHPEYSGWSIHNYFFARSLDAVKPGGLVVGITSHFTLDSLSSKYRKYLSQYADLVGVIRLPNDAFEKNAGTQVTTDLIILRKKDGSQSKGESFLNVTDVTTKDGDTATINEYFANHPEMSLGEHSMEGSMYSDDNAKKEYTLKSSGNIEEQLQKAIETLPDNVMSEGVQAKDNAVAEEFKEASEGMKEGSLVTKDGDIYVVDEGTLVKPHWAKTGKGKRFETGKRYLKVKDKAFKLIDLQVSEIASDDQVEAVRKELNLEYDNFVKNHGSISSNTNKFLEDADNDFATISAFEKEVVTNVNGKLSTHYEKEDIFTKRTQYPYREPQIASNLEDAVLISQNFKGGIDVKYIAKLLDVSEDKAREDVLEKKLAFEDPKTLQLFEPDEYLSGFVKDKLKQAETAAQDDPRYQRNVEALKEALPEDIPFHEVYARIGSHWIPTQLYKDFAKEVFEMNAVEVEKIQLNDRATFKVRINSKGMLSHKMSNEYAVDYGEYVAYGDRLLEDALNSRATKFTSTVRNTDGTSTTITHKDEMMQAEAKKAKLQEEFKKWLAQDDKRKSLVEQTYNNEVNISTERKYTTPIIDKFPGASDHVQLRDYQKRAVVRNLKESTILTHAVGTGKTYTLITTAMEMRRVGTAKKPLIVIQNSTLGSYAKHVKKLYPTAKILMPNEKQRSAKNRKRLFAQMATGDYDMIVVPHSFFDSMAVSPEREASFIREQIGEIEEAIHEMSAHNGSKDRTVKEMEKIKKNKEAKLEKLLSGKKDTNIYFEQLGIDALLVDEAHQYKRSEFYTTMGQVKGIDNGSAQKSSQFLLKSQLVREKTDGKNIILATGTPISNTTAELWSILRYTRPDLLEKYNIQYFDGFATMFGETSTAPEQTPTGAWKEITRFNKYVNGPELLKLWRMASDVVLQEDLDQSLLPNVKNGGPKEVQVNRSDHVSEAIDRIRQEYEWWENLSGSEKKDLRHLPLVLYGRAKKVAIDLRLVEPNFLSGIDVKKNTDSKTTEVVNQVYQKWEETKDNKGTQLVFSDLFQNKETGFNLFKEIRDQLVKKGIPKKEIAIIHDYTEKKRAELFDNVNRGNVRVLLGTTEKMGVGVNVNERLASLHNIDAPARPMDYEQRMGRIVRPGNTYDQVEVLNYGVENTLDSTLYQRLMQKQTFINQIMRGSIKDRSFDDPNSEMQMSFAEMSALFTGGKEGELMKEKITLEGRLQMLRAMKESHDRSLYQTESTIKDLKQYIPNAKTKIVEANELKKGIVKHFPEQKVTSLTVDGKQHTEKLNEVINNFLNKPIRELNTEWEAQIKKGAVNPELDHKKLSLTINGLEATLTLKGETNIEFDDNGRQLEFYPYIRVEANLGNGKQTIGQAYSVDGVLISVNKSISIKKVDTFINERKQRLADLEKSLAENEKAYEGDKTFEHQEELVAGIKRIDEIKEELKSLNDAKNNESKPKEEAQDVDLLEGSTSAKLSKEPPGHIQRAIQFPRQVSESVGIATKASTKATIQEKYRTKEISPENPIRFTTVEELKHIADKGKLFVGKSFEGQAGISAQYSGYGKPLLAYGANDKISAAIIFPEDSVIGKGQQPNEVKINNKLDVFQLRFAIDGHPELLTYDDLKQITSQSETSAQLNKEQDIPIKVNDTLINDLKGIVDDINRIVAPESKVELKERITLEGKERENALNDWGMAKEGEVEAEGLHTIQKNSAGNLVSLIHISLSGKDAGSTAYHEAWHSVDFLLLNDKEREILRNAFPDKEGVVSSERQAEAFEAFVKGKRKLVTPKVKSIFQEVKHFLKRFSNMLKGRGFQTAEDIFEKAYAGEYRQRAEAQTTSNKEKSNLEGKVSAKTAIEVQEDLGKDYDKIEDFWIGEKDWKVKENEIEAWNLQDEIKKFAGTKRYGDKAKDIDKALHIYIDLQRNPTHKALYYNKLTDEQKRIVDLAGTMSSNREFRKIADKIEDSYQQTGLEALDEHLISNVLEHYAGRTWKKNGKTIPTETLRKFGTTTRHSKQRVLDTILEGWAKGYELQHEGATTNLNIIKDEIAQTIENKKMIETMQAITIEDDNGVKHPMLTDKNLEGYEQIEHSNFTRWFWAGKVKKGTVRGRNFFMTEKGQLLERRPVFAPAYVAKQINLILGKSKLRGIPWLDKVTKFNASMKAILLSTSLFHHQAFIRSYMLGTRKKKGEELNPFKAYKEGVERIKKLDPTIKLLVKNGLTLGRQQEWQESQWYADDKSKVEQLIDKHPGTKAIKDKMKDLMQRQSDFLFGRFGAGLKAMAALIEYRNALAEHPGMDVNERGKMVANLINDDFGGLHLQRMHRNQTTQHIARLFLLAPDWTESNIRTMYKMFTGGKEEKELYRRFWASVITKGIGATIVANLLFSLGDDDDAIERFKKAWNAGHFRWLSVDITPLYRAFGGDKDKRKYFSILGHFQDPFKFVTHPVRSAHHKGSILYSAAHEALVGTDWKSDPFTSLDELLGIDYKGYYKTTANGHFKYEPKGGRLAGKTVKHEFGSRGGSVEYEQIPSYLLNQARGMLPIFAQQILGYAMGEIDGFDALSHGIGMKTSSSYEE